MKTLLSTYLHELHIPFTRSYADKLFAEHPHRYNLYGLSDMLSVYKIENAGIQVEDKDLRELASPFVAHVSNDFVVVKQMSDQGVDYFWREKSYGRVSHLLLNRENLQENRNMRSTGKLHFLILFRK